MLQLHRLQSMVIRCIPLSQLAVALSQLVMQDGVASIQLQCVLKDISCSLVLRDRRFFDMPTKRMPP